jgi:hypothetical protein
MKKFAEKMGGKSKVVKQTQGRKYKGKYFKEDPPWLEKNQKPNPLTKIMKHWNKSWYWCSPATSGKCEGCLRVHKLSECKGMAVPGQHRGGTANAGGNEQQLCMMQALTSFLMEEPDE